MAIYIEVKIHAPTDKKGKRVSCSSKDRKRKYFAWDYAVGPRENLRAAAEAYCQIMLNDAGYVMDTVAGLIEYESTKTGLPIGYAWEAI